MDGILLIDKPIGITSFGVVAKVRSIAGKQSGKRIKVGHSGTLDPLASGLLVIILGKYTKKAEQFSKLDKTYEAEVTLGYITDTGDSEGQKHKVSTQKPSKEAVRQALNNFLGVIFQTPPAYSAVKINGRRAYQMARRGQQFEIKPREVEIYSIEFIDYLYPKIHFKAKTA